MEIMVTLRHHATKKHSERYDADDKDSPIQNLYIRKSGLDGQVPASVRVTVTDGEQS